MSLNVSLTLSVLLPLNFIQSMRTLWATFRRPTPFLFMHGLAHRYLAIDCVPVVSLAIEPTTFPVCWVRLTRAKIWNSLPADLRLHLQSLKTFGQRLKRYFFVCH